MSHFAKSRIASLVCGIVGFTVVNTLPMLSSVLKANLDLSAAAIGSYGSAETIGLAFGTFASVFALRYISPRLVAGTGLVLVCAADIASFWLPSISELTAARSIGGFGAGFTQGACYLVYGESHREQNQAIYSIGQLGLAFLVILIAPTAIAAFGWRALFLGLALLTVPALLLIRFFTYTVRVPITHSARGREPLGAPVWLALAGVSMFFVGQGALWAFLETIGNASGFPAATVNTAMTVCAAFGAFGPIVVLLLAERIKSVIPLIGSVALTLVAITCIQSRSPWIYGASISMFYFCLSIFAAYQFGVIGGADLSGRAAVLMSSATSVGFSVAPFVGGQLVEHLGYIGLQLLDGTMMVAALLTLLWLMHKSSNVERAVERSSASISDAAR